MIVYATCKVFVQASGVISGLIFLIKDCKYNSFTLLFDVFFMCSSLLCRRGRGRAARRG